MLKGTTKAAFSASPGPEASFGAPLEIILFPLVNNIPKMHLNGCSLRKMKPVQSTGFSEP